MRTHRHRPAEVDAGIAVAKAPPEQREQQLARQVGRGDAERRGQPAPLGARIELAQQRAVLDHTVVVDAHGNEDQVAFALGVEALQHVVEQTELGFAQAPIDGEASLRVHRLRHTAFGRHLHVALQDHAVERIARVAPHEVRAHRTDQPLQRPDARPLADGVAQRHALRGEEGHEDVVHVAAVVHHEHHGGLRIYRGERLAVGSPKAYAIDKARESFRQPVTNAKVDVGVECRHDLACITVDTLHRHGHRHALVAGMLLRSGLHTRVDHQAVDQRTSPRQFELRQLDLQAHADLVDDLAHLAPEVPARAGEQQPLQRGEYRQQQQQEQQPQRDRDGLIHPAEAFSNTAMLSTCAVCGNMLTAPAKVQR